VPAEPFGFAMNRYLLNILLVLAVVAAAGSGLYLGLGMREKFQTPTPVYESYTPNPLMAEGEEFPDVPVMRADSSVRPTSDLLAGGGVVIFMELGCPPCSVMALQWNEALRGWSDPPPVFGIAAASLERIAAYRDKLGLAFPVYSDTGDVYATAYQVVDYPMRLVIDADRIIRARSYDARAPIDTAQVSALVRGDTTIAVTEY
ncbi:MAG TPA: redoxin domain-containing protein, partial [bacterium]|nr:redoxin domain-containing protein [bacterium]